MGREKRGRWLAAASPAAHPLLNWKPREVGDDARPWQGGKESGPADEVSGPAHPARAKASNQSALYKLVSDSLRHELGGSYGYRVNEGRGPILRPCFHPNFMLWRGDAIVCTHKGLKFCLNFKKHACA